MLLEDVALALRRPGSWEGSQWVIFWRATATSPGRRDIGELMAMPTKNDLLFRPGPRGAAMTHHALSDTLLGRVWKPRTDRKSKTVYRREGIIEFLGMDKFKPHDLRRTAMTQLGLDAVTNNTGITNQDIGRILDHQPEDANGATVIYNVAEQVKQTKVRRPTLDHSTACCAASSARRPTTWSSSRARRRDAQRSPLVRSPGAPRRRRAASLRFR